MTDDKNSNDCCGPAGCAPQFVSIDRRSFLQISGTAAAALAGRAFAGPFEGAANEPLIPKDKKLSAEWMRSLRERGTPTIVRGEALKHVGMPVGGIGCGQLYLGGDGRLWLFDIFNQPAAAGFADSSGPHYAKPLTYQSPIAQGFALRVEQGERTRARRLDATGFTDVSFRGEYPIGRVTYRDPALPVTVALEAFSPFIPLEVDDSSLPATILEYTLTNTSDQPVVASIAGWLGNGACRFTGGPGEGIHRNRIVRRAGFIEFVQDAQPAKESERRGHRDDIVIDRFERETYAPWVATGTAFGPGPTAKKDMPKYQGDVGGEGERVVNTHNARNGEDVEGADRHQGTLTSPAFTIERDFVSFWIGGGAHEKTCVELWIDGERIARASGKNDNRMSYVNFDVRMHSGKSATLRVVDEVSGGWGQIAIDDVVLTDRARVEGPLESREDYGTQSLALLAEVEDADVLCDAVFNPGGDLDGPLAGRASPQVEHEATRTFGGEHAGLIGMRVRIEPGASVKVPFVLAWHFAGLWRDQLRHLPNWAALRREYANRFANASAVAAYVHANFARLAGVTRAWNATWYDTTLPYWFQDRTFASTSTLATATCFRFDDGRFYANEGTYCCAGTCSHVWQYAQGVARVFPSLERYLREKVDFGLAFHPDTGAIDYRGEASRVVAIDGQCGCVLRTLREHQMSGTAGFLGHVWPQAKRSIEYLLAQDPDQDGLLDGPQYNTLDTTWFGKIPWLSSLYIAALRAGERMATDRGDVEFAKRCATVAQRGTESLVKRLFDGEYFVQEIDQAHAEANNVNKGCHADQLLGESWARQLGLPRIVPPEQARSALRALWEHNFAPDAGGYRNAMDKAGSVRGGRWYAMEGEAGLVLCTWPKGGAEDAVGKSNDKWAAMYFNECWTGFEHMVAAHMLFEGLVDEGLAVERAIEDRHAAQRRNPWNEVECSDHYARAMSSYGVFLAACGFELDGPSGHIGFAPRVSPDAFKAPFIGPEGFGTFEQTRDAKRISATLTITHGRLSVNHVALELAPGKRALRATQGTSHHDVDALTASGLIGGAKFTQDGTRVVVSLPEPLVIEPGTDATTIDITIDVE